jgi:repressor LexA
MENMTENMNQQQPLDESKLSSRQRAVLDAIRDLKGQSGMPPTIREIALRVGLSSVSSAKYQIDQLKNMGFLEQIDNVSRGISVSGDAERLKNAQESGLVENPIHFGDFVQVPLVGQIAAGTPITADQNIDEFFALPQKLIGKGKVFLLKVKGDSMIDAAICNGDYVAVREQQTADNGDIVAALLNDEATVKSFKQSDGHTWLIPRNSTMEPILGDHASVMGKVVAVFRSL